MKKKNVVRFLYAILLSGAALILFVKFLVNPLLQYCNTPENWSSLKQLPADYYNAEQREFASLVTSLLREKSGIVPGSQEVALDAQDLKRLSAIRTDPESLARLFSGGHDIYPNRFSNSFKLEEGSADSLTSFWSRYRQFVRSITAVARESLNQGDTVEGFGYLRKNLVLGLAISKGMGGDLNLLHPLLGTAILKQDFYIPMLSFIEKNPVQAISSAPEILDLIALEDSQHVDCAAAISGEENCGLRIISVLKKKFPLQIWFLELALNRGKNSENMYKNYMDGAILTVNTPSGRLSGYYEEQKKKMPSMSPIGLIIPSMANLDVKFLELDALRGLTRSALTGKASEDPFDSAQPLKAKADGDNVILYSIGKDGIDDQGRGDLSLKTPDIAIKIPARLWK
ncbi:MAG: hypothetical protein PHW04_18815 [Candidatus Wallbacteria bacterium]|nr:hypothetical protein [Candidatus Wallbacteria bacterium]